MKETTTGGQPSDEPQAITTSSERYSLPRVKIAHLALGQCRASGVELEEELGHEVRPILALHEAHERGWEVSL